MGSGRVVGVDVEIRPHNRAALDAHPLRPLITLIEGSSTAPETVAQVRAQIQPGERVLVLLDSSHTRQHVADELSAYAPLVSPGSYLVVQDGIMRDLADVPGGQPSWTEDNPTRAVADFLRAHPEFVLEPPAWTFNESPLREGITHWPSGWLKRRDP
jgi:cephalosporin hydroxylase